MKGGELAYVVDYVFNPSYEPQFEWDVWPRRVHTSISHGQPVDPAWFPKRAFLTSRHKAIPDVFGMLSGFCVNDSFRQVVEALEPGVHQFIPLQLERRNGVPVRKQDYYLLNICQKFDALIVARSRVKWVPIDGVPSAWRLECGLRSEGLVLSRPEVAGRHAWRADKQLGSNVVYFSDRLVEMITEAGLKKLVFTKAEELDEPWDPKDNLAPRDR